MPSSDDEGYIVTPDPSSGETSPINPRNVATPQEEPQKTETSQVGATTVTQPTLQKLGLPNPTPCRNVEVYQCLNKIAEGTYGAVYRALDRETGSIVALKHIKRADICWKEGFPVSSLREISILLEFRHPNILSVLEVVTNDRRDQYYVVMEYVEHELRTLLSENKPNFTLSERKGLVQQLLEGTRYMHDNWVMHRDLKTTNILYNNRGIVKICDFGLARKFGSPIKKYTPNVVTHWYRAPEIFLGVEKYDEKVDIWSIGCIFAEIILGKPLFMGTNDADTLDKIFRLCGSLNEIRWPGYKELQVLKQGAFVVRTYEPTFHKVFSSGIMGGMVSGSTCMTREGLDLLMKMLAIDPRQRISAKEALQHPYFVEEKPRPQPPTLMPTIPDTNCIAKSKRKGASPLGQPQGTSNAMTKRVNAAKFISMMEKKRPSRPGYN